MKAMPFDDKRTVFAGFAIFLASQDVTRDITCTARATVLFGPQRSLEYETA